MVSFLGKWTLGKAECLGGRQCLVLPRVTGAPDWPLYSTQKKIVVEIKDSQQRLKFPECLGKSDLFPPSKYKNPIKSSDGLCGPLHHSGNGQPRVNSSGQMQCLERIYSAWCTHSSDFSLCSWTDGWVPGVRLGFCCWNLHLDMVEPSISRTVGYLLFGIL